MKQAGDASRRTEAEESHVCHKASVTAQQLTKMDRSRLGGFIGNGREEKVDEIIYCKLGLRRGGYDIMTMRVVWRLTFVTNQVPANSEIAHLGGRGGT